MTEQKPGNQNVDMTILVLSPALFCRRIRDCIKIASRGLIQREIRVIIAEKPDVDGLAKEITDFVVVIVDTCEANAYTTCESNIKYLGENFAATRTCLVNGRCRSGRFDQAKEMIRFADEYRTLYINAEILDDVSCAHFATKLVRLASKIMGLENGIPIVIPIPADHLTTVTRNSLTRKSFGSQ